MRKALALFDYAGLIYLPVLLLFVTVLGLSQDQLLLQTDIRTLLQFYLGGALILSAMPALIFALFMMRAGPTQTASAVRTLSCLIFGLLVFGLLVHYLDSSVVYLYTLDQAGEYFKVSGKLERFLLGTGALFLMSLLVAWLIVKAMDYSDRVQVLSRCALGLALISFLVVRGMDVGGIKATARENPKANMILIVLDGLSAKYLEPYNPGERTPFFRELASESVLFTNMRTNFTYTSGFFYGLYSGRKDAVRRYHLPGEERGPELARKENLFSLLQQAGVNARWITYHNNGVPDVYESRYRGLRASFLISPLKWLPRWLGIDYHIFELTGENARGRNMGYRADYLNRKMAEHFGAYYLSPLQNGIIDEIENLRADTRPFFMVLHLPIDALTKVDEDPRIWELEDGGEMEKGDFNKRLQKIVKAQGYTYTEEDKDVVEVLRDKNRNHINSGMASLKSFYEEFKARDWNQDTLMMVTADHGKMFSRGKIYYGYHPDEEVARVPLLINWKGRTGKDDRLGETIDIVETVLDFFAVDKHLAKEAQSLLSRPREKRVTTLTTRHMKRKEWFLNVYQGSDKYTFNINPENFSARKEVLSGYFTGVTQAKGKQATESMGFELKPILRDYGFPEAFQLEAEKLMR